ncbi:MAG: F0F1 ATP synthase subunit A [Pirellulales bacterium]|nr:F0F1 ATP synthase subunit A [Pirellulales bacterium]
MAADTTELFGHVKDAQYFHLPNGTEEGLIVGIPQPAEFAPWLPQPVEIVHGLGVESPPQWFADSLPVPWAASLTQKWQSAAAWLSEPWQLTKFMVLELVAAALMIVIFVWLARKMASGERPRGVLWNMFEAVVVFLRDEVARPAIGRKDADRFLPYIWTVFFFILFCNLLGLVPWAGSPTGAWGCTLVLALITFLTVIGTGMKKFGLIGFWTGQVPHMELPLVMAILIKPMVLLIEVFGLAIKHFVLSVRLLANMFAGHLVLAVILGFIAATAERHVAVWTGVMLSSVFGAIALSLLELFVAFLQAYIFAFLSALFIGMAVHQH